MCGFISISITSRCSKQRRSEDVSVLTLTKVIDPSPEHPHWKFDLTFFYETIYYSHLKAKTLEVKVFQKQTLSGNRLLGTATIDLHTIANGSILHDVPLKDPVRFR